MTAKESGPARNEAAPHHCNCTNRFSPRGSVGTAHSTGVELVRQRLTYLTALAETLGQTRFLGATTAGDLYYVIVDDPTGRRLPLTAAGMRTICPDETRATHNALRLDLIRHGAQLLCEIDNLTVNALRYGLTNSTTLRREVDALICERTGTRIRDAIEDAGDAQQHLVTLLCPRRAHHVHAATRRHPASHRTTGGAR